MVDRSVIAIMRSAGSVGASDESSQRSGDYGASPGDGVLDWLVETAQAPDVFSGVGTAAVVTKPSKLRLGGDVPKVSDLSGRIAHTAITGAVGVATYSVLRRLVTWAPKRQVAVSGTVLGLRAWRGAERGVEVARLTAADIVAEAKGRVGESVSPPGAIEDEPGHTH